MAAPAGTSDIPALLQRLRSGRDAQQAAAAEALFNLIIEGNWDDSIRQIAAAGGIPALVQAMSASRNEKVIYFAALTLSLVVDGEEDLTKEFMAAGGLPAVLSCLRSDLQDARAGAAAITNSATRSEAWGPEIVRGLSAAGTIPVLARLLGSNQPIGSARTLANMCILEPDNKDAVVAAGALPALMQSLRIRAVSPTAALLAQALSYGSFQCRAALVDAGAVPCLVPLLSSAHPDDREAAVASLSNLMVFRCEAHTSAIAAAGAIPRLVICLHNCLGKTQTLAARALKQLCHDSPERSRMAVAEGAAPALQRLQASSSDESLRQEAGGALNALNTALVATAAPSPPSRSPAAPYHHQRPPAPHVCATPGCDAARGLRRCGGCGTVRYCSVACSRKHWRGHKAECRRLQAEQAAAAEQAEQAAEASPEPPANPPPACCVS